MRQCSVFMMIIHFPAIPYLVLAVKQRVCKRDHNGTGSSSNSLGGGLSNLSVEMMFYDLKFKLTENQLGFSYFEFIIRLIRLSLSFQNKNSRI